MTLKEKIVQILVDYRNHGFNDTHEAAEKILDEVHKSMDKMK